MADEVSSIALVRTDKIMTDTNTLSNIKNHFEFIHDDGKAVPTSDLAQSMYELNNLLSIVLSQTTIALSKLPATSPSRDNMERVQQATEQLADLLLQMNFKMQNEDYVLDMRQN